MRIFIFEYVTAGGWRAIDSTSPSSTPTSLLREGAAMRHAVTRDFLQIPGVEVCTIQDSDLDTEPPPNCHVEFVSGSEEFEPAFAELVRSSNHVLVIAPELGGELDYWTSLAQGLGSHLLSPDPEFVSLASDKWRTYHYLRERGVPTPETLLLHPGEVPPARLRGPVIVKPVDGCGSLGVQKLDSPRDKIDWSQSPDRMIMQNFCDGLPASVVKLCGPKREIVLPAIRQRFSREKEFQYIGGEGPLPQFLCDRATRLVSPPLGTTGYVGFDIVLGDAEDGSEDYVIEINPRLTTSYLGLSAMCTTNLSQAMFDVAMGKEPHLEWQNCRVAFSTDGTLQFNPVR